MIIVKNLLLGHSKPGCRRESDSDFYQNTFKTFKELLNIASDNRSDVLFIGRHFGSMKLDQWLKIIAILNQSKVNVYVVCSRRPADDLIALSNAGHIHLLMTNTTKTMNDGTAYSSTGDSISLERRNYALIVNTLSGSVADSLQNECVLHNATQVDQNQPNALMASFAGNLSEISLIDLSSVNDEASLISMDYVEAISAVSVTSSNESDFIKRLEANLSTSHIAEDSLEETILQLDTDSSAKEHLLMLCAEADKLSATI